MKRPQMCRGPKLTSVEIDQMEAAAAREDLLVSFGEGVIPCSIRNHQNLQ